MTDTPPELCVSRRLRWKTVGVAMGMFILFVVTVWTFGWVAGVHATDFGVTLWPERTASSARIKAVTDALLQEERLAAWLAEQPFAKKFPPADPKGGPLPWEALTDFAAALTSDDAKARLVESWVQQLGQREAEMRESVRSFYKAADGSTERAAAAESATTRHGDALSPVLPSWLKNELPAAEVINIARVRKVTSASTPQQARELEIAIHSAALSFFSHATVTARVKEAVLDDLSQASAQGSILTGVERDYTGRWVWALLAALFLTAAASAILGGFSMVQSLESDYARSLPAVYVLVVAAGLLVGRLVPDFGPAFLAEPLQRYATFYDIPLARAVGVLNAIALAAICALLFVGWSSFLVETRDDEHLGHQLAALRWSFHMSTFVLLAGVLEVYALFQWPSAFLGEAGSALLQNGAKTAAISLGAIFSTLLLLIYLPGAKVLVNEARARKTVIPVGAKKPDAKRTEALDAMLEHYGFDESITQLAIRFATIFAPLLIAPLADLIGLVE